ncbi:hypothetical protein GCM10027435_09610 [Haloparvum alkalitolerans]|uniref:hypothetical protein n=1 Tax=Haloparvum alkalitolerans TaxID=1042953 RepID=UPI003CFB7496
MTDRSSPAIPIYRRRPREFYALWILATTTYGVGDIVTTVALVWFVPALVEGNPLVAFAIERVGLAGLVAVKLVGFGVMVWISVVGGREDDALVYYFGPGLLTLFGLAVTANNLRLLFAV